MLIVRTIRKPFTSPNNTVINTTGWTAVATGVANGSTANANGAGSMGFKAFWKIAESSSETNPVVTWGTTSAPGACVAVSYQLGAGEAWATPTGNGGGDATARTSQTSTIASHISVTSGDLVDFFRGQCDDSGALTVPTITQTGVTYNTVTEYPATALLDGTSNDIAADGGYRTATAGTSSAAAVITGTSVASEEHGAWMTRLRVNPVILPSSIASSEALGGPTLVHGNANIAPSSIASDEAVGSPPVVPATLPGRNILPTAITSEGADYSAIIAADGAISHWRLGEPSGTTAVDVISANNGTYINGPTLGIAGAITGDADTAATFSSPSVQYVTVASDAPFRFAGTTPFSLEAWINHTPDGSYRNFLAAKNAGEVGGYALYSQVDEFGFARRAASSSNTALLEPGISAGVWHHVVGTYDGTSMRLYLDGTLVAGPVASSKSLPSDSTFTIAANGAAVGTVFNGSIDEVAVYDYALSAAAVLEHYETGTGAAEAVTVGTPTLDKDNYVLPTGIASAAAVGTPTVIHGNKNLLPTGIVSTEAGGTPTIAKGVANIAVSAIASAENLPAPVVASASAVAPTAIDGGPPFDPYVYHPSAFDTHFGFPTVVASEVTASSILPSAIGSQEVVSNPTVVHGGVIVAPSGITSGESVGAPTLRTTATILPTSITSAGAVGTPVVRSTAAILPTGITSAGNVGSPVVRSTATILPTAIASGEVFGLPAVTPGSTSIIVGAVPSGEAVGNPLVNSGQAGPQFIFPAGITGGEAVGTPTIVAGQASGATILPTGITSGQASGSPSVLHGGVSIGPTSVASGESLGTPSIVSGGLAIVPQGIASAQSVGNPSIIPGTARVVVGSIISGELFGIPTVSLPAGNTVTPNGITTAEILGSPLLIVGNAFIRPGSISTEEVFGLPRMLGFKSGWKWVNNSPAMGRTHEVEQSTLQDGFGHTRETEIPVLQGGFARTRENEGDSE
jgi:hypothetical protein